MENKKEITKLPSGCGLCGREYSDNHRCVNTHYTNTELLKLVKARKGAHDEQVPPSRGFTAPKV